ncbi:hypothetical protein [Croceiramulus getboli]|nr:toll/interleukin-1 receptor domain-containing protein [Flavobacteriaceae bacterium YJPT1-3]
MSKSIRKRGMKIFISHSSKNENYGNLLVGLLRDLGVNEKEIIFTSNVAYGIPVAENIFHWLKSQIEEKPFVIYLLSKEYYKSIACLNEMGAAWIVESEHAAIFTPNFDLSSQEFQNGALDPREIGFKINDEDRFLSFIQILSKYFKITESHVIISQSVKKFIADINRIKEETTNVLQVSPESVNMKASSSPKKGVKLVPKADSNSTNKNKEDLFSKFLNLVVTDKLKQDELLLFHYIIDTTNVRLKTGWQEEQEILKIKDWEKINDIKNILSKNYSGVLRKFELRGFTEVSQVTSSDNPKEVKVKDEIALNVLDLPNNVLSKIEEVVQNNFYEHPEEVENENDYDNLPF